MTPNVIVNVTPVAISSILSHKRSALSEEEKGAKEKFYSIELSSPSPPRKTICSCFFRLPRDLTDLVQTEEATKPYSFTASICEIARVRVTV